MTTVPADGCRGGARVRNLSCVWPAVAASVAEARTAVSAFAEAAGATADALAAVSLAVSEAVTNAVLHAYLDRETPGPVEVRARCEAELVVVEVANKGRGMLPRNRRPGLGLGLPLIAQMTAGLEVRAATAAGPDEHGLRARRDGLTLDDRSPPRPIVGCAWTAPARRLPSLPDGSATWKRNTVSAEVPRRPSHGRDERGG